MAAKPSLLFLTQRIPYPADKGEKIRYLPILRHLLQSYSVHLGCLVDDRSDRVHEATVRAMVSSAHFAHLDRRVARLACLRGLLTGDALSVAYFADAGLARWVRRVRREIRPDVVFVCSSNMAPYVLEGPRPARMIVDLCDVDSEKWRAYAQDRPGPMTWVYRREWRRVAALEAEIAGIADWCSFVSPQEAALFARTLPQAGTRTGTTAGIRAVSNGVDAGYFDPSLTYEAPYETGPANYVFTGTMDYPPNVDAAGWFARDILPQLGADARFHIVGASPSPAVLALARPGRVLVTGRVADTRPYMAHATACVAPLRIARGIQNKVLEAMAMARPVVVTPQALEGIAARPGLEVLQGDTAAALADCCRKAPEAAAIGLAARARVLADYTWPERLRGFDALLAG